MGEFSVEPFDGTEGTTEPPASVPSEPTAPQQVPQVSSSEATPVTSQIREFFHSQFGGISNIWPTSVCGH